MVKSIKQSLILAFAFLGLILSSCNKELETTLVDTDNIEIDDQGQLKCGSNNTVTICGNSLTKQLLNSSNTSRGTITVSNDANYLYVKYTGSNSWKFSQVNLYVGNCNNVPLTSSGTANINCYPYRYSNNCPFSSITYKIPLSKVGNCFCVSAYAVGKLYKNGCWTTNTLWAQGQAVGNTNFGTKFEYCKQTCGVVSQGCATPTDVWFTTQSEAWFDVTIGDYVYFNSEATSLYNYDGAPNGRDIFLAALTIRLSAGTILPNATVWADLVILENWLNSQGKLNLDMLPSTDSAAVLAALARTEAWISNNTCQ